MGVFHFNRIIKCSILPTRQEDGFSLVNTEMTSVQVICKLLTKSNNCNVISHDDTIKQIGNILHACGIKYSANTTQALTYAVCLMRAPGSGAAVRIFTYYFHL